mgnify:CR=1 FL=1
MTTPSARDAADTAAERADSAPQAPDAALRALADADDTGSTDTGRDLRGAWRIALTWVCAIYAAFHVLTLNFAPVETWTFRLVHVLVACALIFALHRPANAPLRILPEGVGRWIDRLALALAVAAAVLFLRGEFGPARLGFDAAAPWMTLLFAQTMFAAAVAAMTGGMLRPAGGHRIPSGDLALILVSLLVLGYVLVHRRALEFRFGVVPTQADMWVAICGVAVVLETTRRLTGWMLPAIAGVFVLFAFLGPWLPGFLEHRGYSPQRFFTYIFGLDGIFGVTTGVSSTYIFVFIIFAAFLKASRVGDYFVECAFAVAGALRGGPAKAAVIASGLMGTVSGAAAGNVAATGSFTIPLMRRVGYSRTNSGAIEAAASTGGQILPPIMGSGAFIMAEITGIPYRDLIIAAAIPGILYFASMLLMVDNMAQRMGLRGLPRAELPGLRDFINRVYLFIPIIILVVAVFSGYSVLRAGSMALMAAVVTSWLSPTHRMGPVSVFRALDEGTRMALQIIAVCACAGIVVGVIALTGVGLRFSNMMFGLSQGSVFVALVLAMLISVLLGMGMPTTAAYAVAASVVAPGLIRMGLDPLVAHLFVFYYAVMSSITPPVALAAYAAAAISGGSAMATATTAFRLGLVAFIVPFMFIYSPGLLLQGDWMTVSRAVITAGFGIYMLSAAVQGWLFGRLGVAGCILAAISALLSMYGDALSDQIGLGIAVLLSGYQLWRGRAVRAAEIGGGRASGDVLKREP